MFTTLFLAAMVLGSQDVKEEYPPPGSYPHPFKIQQEYDRFRDITTLEMDFGTVWSDDQNKLELEVRQIYEGEGRVKPVGDPDFRFLNTGRDGWRYLKYHPIIFIADGKRLSYDPKHDGDVGNGYVLEFMRVSPEKSELLSLIYSKKVEVRVGLDQFSLKQSHLNALKDFCSYVALPSRKLGDPGAKKHLEDAISYESQGMDDLARSAYQRAIDQAGDSYEAKEAAKGIKRLDDPARKEANKRAMEAQAQAQLARQREKEEASLRRKIETNFRLGRSLEGMNTKGALSYYREILKLAYGLKPEPPEVQKAKTRIKALSETE